jgi:hypothetical protein
MARKRRTTKARRVGMVQKPLRSGASPAGLGDALAWFVQRVSLISLKLHGNVSWTPGPLVVLAVLWVWSDQSTLTGAFGDACRSARTMFGGVAVTSFQGLMGALRSYGPQLLPAVWAHLQGLMEEHGGEHGRIGRWLPLAVDGSRISTPRTMSNEQAFAAKNYGQGGRGKNRTKWKNKKRRSKRLSEPVKPQIWLTLIWHMGLKMPWCWATGASTACERQHLVDLLDTHVFPKDTLFCGDAGFIGYDFWSALLKHRHSFLIRVGANVRLLRRLGTARSQGNLVYLWPAAQLRRRQPPVVLRLIVLQGTRGRVYLVTNVHGERALSTKQVSQLYRARWGIELQFRALKQTFGRRKLRSRTAEHALVELNWSLVGLWLVQLFAVKEQIKLDSPPAQSSVALALNVIQDAMRTLGQTTAPSERLAWRLARATKDTYIRTSKKRARYRPKYKDKPTASKPILLDATPAQRAAYTALATAA